MAKTYQRKWKIERDLPETGQSYTFIVEDISGEKTGKFVLKRNKNPKRELRFRNEVETLLALKHEKIVEIIDSDLEDENPWYVQEYYEGGDIEKLIRENPDIPWEQKFDIFIQICEGLDYCHSQGIYHRDIKPANVFLREDLKSIVIGDFGLCWVPVNGERVTSTSEAVGSWHYIPPEYRDGRVDNPTKKGDIYSLGKVLYYIFSGGRSFDREDHRKGKWNLVSTKGKPTPTYPDYLYLEHLNLLLDEMIIYNPEERIRIYRVLERIKIIKRLVIERFNLIHGTKYAPCNYCGQGYYQPKAASEGSLSSFLGLQAAAISPEIRHFRALACDYCGNVQLFRLPGEDRDWFSNS